MSSTFAIPRIDTSQANVQEKLRELRQRLSPRGNVISEAGRKRTIEVFGEPLAPLQVVERICEAVRTQRLASLLDYTRRIDRAEITPQTLRVTSEELAAAHRQADPRLLETIRRIRQNIQQFQQALLPSNTRIEREGGCYLEQRFLPMRRIGICVPGGAAAYPSTVLMTAVPAQVAGVQEIVVATPPTQHGAYSPVLLATCHELGIREVYRMGGAQGVAAMAYGVEGVPQVDKIVGPGNLFVALAKKYVYGEVDIDSIAGPSEIVVIADESTRADFTAADLLAQAEHAPGASVLITWSAQVIEDTLTELEKQAARLERGELARQSLSEFGAMILVRDAAEACALADWIAPEHLHLATDNAEELLRQIPHAGTAFLGNHTPVAMGDYYAGPSHVLPTGGTARFASGLSARDFFRSHGVIHYTPSSLATAAEDIARLAAVEGLTAHRASVEIRVPRGK